MPSALYLLWILVIIWQPTLGFFNLCSTSKNEILSQEECADLYFEPGEKATSLGLVRLELEQNSLKIIPEAAAWTNTFLKISTNDNITNHVCSKLPNEGNTNLYCFNFSPEMENETFLLEYKIEKLPEICFRRFLFTLHSGKEIPLFIYIDQTDMSRLVLHAQKLSPHNISFYQVEAYKEKNGNTNLQDLKVFSSNEEIYFELFTYNDVGYYYFVVSVGYNNSSIWDLKISTPKVFIGRRSTRVVIGIVGASFILPFILFLFHMLTKKYPSETPSEKPEERIIVAYKSSTKKHNDVVLTFAAVLEHMDKNLTVDLIDLSKTTRKFPQKFCIDSLLVTHRIVYVAPPKHDLNPILIDKSFSEKEILAVIFDHCADKLPQFFATNKTFKLFEDFDKFLSALNISGVCDSALFRDLVKKTEDAKTEAENSANLDTVPKIVVTESEPQEHDSLISAKVVL